MFSFLSPFRVAAFGMVLFAAAQPLCAANILTNGDFESGDLYSYRGSEHGSLPGWSLTAHYTSMDAPPMTGSRAMNLNDGMTDNGGGLAVMQQSVSTIIGQEYLISGWISANTGGQANEISFYWDNVQVLDRQNLNTDGYEQFTATVVATSELTNFAFKYGNNGTGLYADNFSISATPEPSRCVLTGLGLAGLLLQRKRSS